MKRREYPRQLLGDRHYEAFGASLGVLVKLIDAGERLTVQAHPTKEMARSLFNSEYGKTECWHFLPGRCIDGQPPCIYFGFKPGITREYWQTCFERQDIPAMLACLHKFPVKAGDTYLIRGGVPHAIGAGCFLVEIQEPTDYTVRTERISPSGLQISDFMCHQGLGFQHMFDCFDYSGADADTVKSRGVLLPKELYRSSEAAVTQLVGPGDTDSFSLRRIDVEGHFQFQQSDSFYGLYVLSGKGTLHSAAGSRPISAASQFFIPAGCSGLELECAGGEPLCLIQAFGPKV